MLAIDKPAGLLTVPGRGGKEPPALSALVREVAPEALPVHRLDRDTSGVVLFAVTRQAHRALNAAFESRRAEKTYLALVRSDLAKAQRVDVRFHGLGPEIAGTPTMTDPLSSPPSAVRGSADGPG